MALVEYYVSAAGGGAHDGTSEANAWTLSEAITANNALGAGGAAGRRYNVKGAHTARGAADTISVGGTATSPAIWRGYNSTIGDLDNGTRDAYGALDTTNYPDIGYDATYRLVISATHVVFTNFDAAVNLAGDGCRVTGANNVVSNCRWTNSSTNASASALYCSAQRTRVINCDGSTAASGGRAAFEAASSGVTYIGCRATSPGASAFLFTGTITADCTKCTAYDSSVGFNNTGGSVGIFVDCTIYGCVNGAEVVNTNATVHTFVSCMITDNSGYGIDLNGGGSGAYVVAIGCRFRDNGADYDATYDWTTGTALRNITTDTGGATTDYADPATNKDFSLVYASPGFEQGFSHKTHIGACGFDLPTPAEIGAAAWNDTTAPNRTLT